MGERARQLPRVVVDVVCVVGPFVLVVMLVTLGIWCLYQYEPPATQTQHWIVTDGDGRTYETTVPPHRHLLGDGVTVRQGSNVIELAPPFTIETYWRLD